MNKTKVTSEKKHDATKTGRPTELPEISDDCWREGDVHLIILKEYFRANLQDIVSICPDLMMLTNLCQLVVIQDSNTPNRNTNVCDITLIPKGYLIPVIPIGTA